MDTGGRVLRPDDPITYLKGTLMNKPVRRPICFDCAVNVSSIREYAYMLLPHIWCEAKCPGCLCIGCLETRLGRKLEQLDFNWKPPITREHGNQSERLRDRLRVKPGEILVTRRTLNELLKYNHQEI